MPRLRLGLSFASFGLALATGVWAGLTRAPWFGLTEQFINLCALLGTAMATRAIARDDVRGRVFVACAMLLGAPALRIGELCGHRLPYITWDHGLVASIASVAVIAAIVGLVRRRPWARWLALGGAWAGLGGSVLNGLGTLSHPGMYTWGHAGAASGCAAIVLLLSGASMRDAFEAEVAGGVWRSPDPVVRALRWAVITTLVSAPMLIVYAAVQPIVPGTKVIAGSLALLQILAAGLCIARKVVGALLLTLTGSALLVFTLACAAATHALRTVDPWVMSYYAVFWVPAGVVSVVAGAVMLRPLVALLRR